ncbi:MAG: hypothetical protein KDA60_22250, partial [Planctomycetales bacterium]|nr:hypothetical protein [Planctomycetales bacterium]
MSRFTVLFFVLSAGLLPTGASAEEVAIPVFRDDFEAGFDRWSTTDQTKKVWENPLVKKPSDGEDNHVLRVTGPSDYQPPFRSPHSIALVKDLYVSDFELTVKLQNTRPDAGNHRDLCIFWG